MAKAKHQLRFRSSIDFDPAKGYRTRIEYGPDLENEAIGPWESEAEAEQRIADVKAKVLPALAARGATISANVVDPGWRKAR